MLLYRDLLSSINSTKVAKKKNKERKEVVEENVSFLKEETVEAITAVVFLLIGVFLTFAAFGSAGFLGEAVYKISNFLFGIGYYLIPIILFGLGISFLASLKHNLAITKIVGAIFIFISGLGIVDLVFSKGGLIGDKLSMILEKLLGFWVALIFLFSILLISVLVIFNLSLKVDFKKIFAKKEKSLTEEEDAILMRGIEKNTPQENPIDDEDDEDAQVPVVAPTPSPAPSTKPSGLIFFAKRSAQQTFTPPPLSLLQKILVNQK